MKWIAWTLSTSFLAGTVRGDGTSVEKAVSHDLEVPDPFFVDFLEGCSENALIAAWCDASLLGDNALQCGMLSDFQEYACRCNHPNLCPTECINGSQLIAKTRTTIRCRGLPVDSPNYILTEHPKPHRHDCANNAVVSAWCDEYINKHVECSLYPDLDQYVCRCSGRKTTNCPDECIGGSEALLRTPHGVVCTGIPEDHANYEVMMN